MVVVAKGPGGPQAEGILFSRVVVFITYRSVQTIYVDLLSANAIKLTRSRLTREVHGYMCIVFTRIQYTHKIPSNSYSCRLLNCSISTNEFNTPAQMYTAA